MFVYVWLLHFVSNLLYLYVRDGLGEIGHSLQMNILVFWTSYLDY